jgi:hypothetical protein
MPTRKTASGLWVPASASRSTAPDFADTPRAHDVNRPARGIASALLWSVAIWATVALAALSIFS